MASTNFTSGTVIASSWLNDVDETAYVKTRGVVGLADDGTTVQDWVAANPTAQLEFPNVSASVADAQLVSGDLIGRGARSSVMTASGTGSVLKLGDSTNPNLWSWRRVQGIQIQGNAKAADGIEYNSATATPYFSGRWVVDCVTIEDTDKAIHKPIGSIGQLHSALCLSGNNYGYYALSGVGSGSGMHTGADLFLMGELSGNSVAAYYVNATQGGPGGNRLNGTVIENNPGFGIALENYGTCYTPFVMDAVWFEANATSGSVTLPVAGAVAPVDFYASGTPHAVLTNGIVPKVRLASNAHLNIQNSFISADKTTWSIDSTSRAFADNVHIDGGAHPIVIGNVVSLRRALGGFAARWRGLPRNASAKRHTGTVIESKSWANRNSETFTGTTSVAANIVADGRIFDSCLELVIPAGNTQNLGSSINITSGKWYFLSFDIKPVGGAASSLVIQHVNGGTAFGGLDDVMDTAARWTTVCAGGEATSTFTSRLTIQNTSGSNVTVRLSAYQLIEFDTQPELLEYINSLAYDPGSTYPRIMYGTAAPTNGTWAVGDQMHNITPAVGTAKGWMCTVAGAPGTWVSTGNL